MTYNKGASFQEVSQEIMDCCLNGGFSSTKSIALMNGGYQAHPYETPISHFYNNSISSYEPQETSIIPFGEQMNSNALIQPTLYNYCFHEEPSSSSSLSDYTAADFILNDVLYNLGSNGCPRSFGETADQALQSSHSLVPIYWLPLSSCTSVVSLRDLYPPGVFSPPPSTVQNGAFHVPEDCGTSTEIQKPNNDGNGQFLAVEQQQNLAKGSSPMTGSSMKLVSSALELLPSQNHYELLSQFQMTEESVNNKSIFEPDQQMHKNSGQQNPTTSPSFLSSISSSEHLSLLEPNEETETIKLKQENAGEKQQNTVSTRKRSQKSRRNKASSANKQQSQHQQIGPSPNIEKQQQQQQQQQHPSSYMQTTGTTTTPPGDSEPEQELDTQLVARTVSAELKRYSIPQAVFAECILGRSQGTLSDLLRNPKPWPKLKSGRETFRRMALWLQEPASRRMSALRLAACTRKEELILLQQCQEELDQERRLKQHQKQMEQQNHHLLQLMSSEDGTSNAKIKCDEQIFPKGFSNSSSIGVSSADCGTENAHLYYYYQFANELSTSQQQFAHENNPPLLVASVAPSYEQPLLMTLDLDRNEIVMATTRQ